MINRAFDTNTILKAAFLVGAVVVLGLLIWKLTLLLVLTFAAVLFAILLRSLAMVVERFTPLRSPWSLLIAVLFLMILIAAFMFLLGMQITEQASTLVNNLPQYIDALGQRIGVPDLQQRLTQQLQGASGSGVVGTAAGYTFGLINAVSSTILIIITGIYLAHSPHYYFTGVMKLVPAPFADEVASTFRNIGHALQLWLAGQLISMVIVGTLITVGLTVIGVPSSLALGFMAGIAEFVPFVGPFLAAVPALLLALSEGGTMVYWVIGLYAVVQQLESYLIMPLVQKKTVHLPPVLGILAIVGFGTLFGLPGVLLGAPLTVVLLVAVKQLYIREALDKPVDVPGENDTERGSS